MLPLNVGMGMLADSPSIGSVLCRPGASAGVRGHPGESGGVRGVPMRIADILKPACVKVPLTGADKQSALFELVDVLASHCEIPDVEHLKQAVWQRETIRTTGIGHGIAVPHGKTEGLKQLNMAIGLTAEPLDFNAIDGKPVSLVILLASPIDQTGPHVQALGKISRMLIDDTFREAVKLADSPEKLYMMLIEHEAAMAGA